MSVVASEVRSPYLIPAAEHPEDLQPSDYFHGRERIARLIETVTDYETLFAQMMEVVRGFVPFDWAYLFIFTEGREYSRFICRYGPYVAFLSRWFPTGEEYRDYILKSETWADDLETFIRQGRGAEEMLRRPDLRIALEAGFKAFVALPVQERGTVKGGLVLYSKEKGKYKAEDRTNLERLLLGQALLPVFHAADCCERDFVTGLMKKIALSESSEALAETVVHEIAEFYKFQNVSIFKVNALRGYFRLLAQAQGSDDGTHIPDGYTRPLETGLLGEAYRRGDYVLVGDIPDQTPDSQNDSATARDTHSALCIPIKLSDRILWILNLEDRRVEAFTRGEVETLKDIIEQIQLNIDRIFQRLVLKQVLDVIPEAVVIAKQNGEILYPTKDALTMLQRPRTPGDNILNYLGGLEFSQLGPSSTTATVTGAQGNKTPVLIQKFKLDEEYDHVVVVLQDMREAQWQRDFELLKAALSEAAAQVRVPVSLLSSFVQRLGQRVQDDDLQDFVRKAMRQLGQVELTYDRVVGCYEAQTSPKREASIDVNRALEYILSDLPNLERRSVQMSACEDRPLVKADPYRLVFALGSMLAYLLRSRASAKRIVIKVSRSRDAVEVAMTGAVPPVPESRGLAALVEDARTQIALGEGAIARIAKEYGGTFERRPQGKGRERLSLRLAAKQ